MERYNTAEKKAKKEYKKKVKVNQLNEFKKYLTDMIDTLRNNREHYEKYKVTDAGLRMVLNQNQADPQLKQMLCFIDRISALASYSMNRVNYKLERLKNDLPIEDRTEEVTEDITEIRVPEVKEPESDQEVRVYDPFSEEKEDVNNKQFGSLVDDISRGTRKMEIYDPSESAEENKLTRSEEEFETDVRLELKSQVMAEFKAAGYDLDEGRVDSLIEREVEKRFPKYLLRKQEEMTIYKRTREAEAAEEALKDDESSITHDLPYFLYACVYFF